MLGAFLAGVPICPVSPAYSLVSADYGRLKHIHRLIEPALVYVDSFEAFRPALAALDLVAAPSSCARRARPEGSRERPFAELLAHGPHARRSDAARSPCPPITSPRSSSRPVRRRQPKGVVNTHGMLSANQQMLRQCWRFLERRRRCCSTGCPGTTRSVATTTSTWSCATAGRCSWTTAGPRSRSSSAPSRTSARSSPNVYFSVPAGYAMLLPYLEKDDELARVLPARAPARLLRRRRAVAGRLGPAGSPVDRPISAGACP